MRSSECNNGVEKPKYKIVCDLIDTEERTGNLAGPSKASRNLQEQSNFELQGFRVGITGILHGIQSLEISDISS